MDKLGGPNPTRSDPGSAVAKLFRMTDLEDKLLRKMILEPLDLTGIVGRSVPDDSGSSSLVCWKLLLSVPSCEPDTPTSSFVDMLKHKLSRSSLVQDDPRLLSLYSAKHCLKDVSVCVRLVDQDSLEQIGYSDKTRREFLMGTSGLLFVHLVEDESLDEAKDRLQVILDGLPSNPAIPVQVITTDDDAEIAEIQDELGLDAFKAEGRIKSFDVAVMEGDIFAAGNMGKCDIGDDPGYLCGFRLAWM